MSEDFLLAEEEDRDDKWWRSPNEHTKVKISAVSKYFPAWARIIAPSSPTLRYIDCYAGRGRFADGYPSVPVNILTFASEDDECRKKLVAYLNDNNPKTTAVLKQNIDAIPGIQGLANPPEFFNRTIDADWAQRLYPTG